MEISEINLSYCRNFIDFRIDSNTYKQKFLDLEKILNHKKAIKLDEYSKSVKNFGAYSLTSKINFVEEGLPFLRAQNIKDNYIDWNHLVYIDKQSHEMLDKSYVEKNQVLLTMAGEYLGKAAVYDKDQVISSNQAIAKITLKKNALNPYYISTFLNSYFGQMQIDRLKTVTGQPNINMMQIREIRIPMASKEFQDQIAKLVKIGHGYLAESEEIYKQAEKKLLSTLSLLDVVNPINEAISVNVKNFSSSFDITGRLDAEYYQKRYELLIKKIIKNNNRQLQEIVRLKKSIEPGSLEYKSEGIPFIRVSNLNKYGINNSSVYLSENKYNVDGLKPKKDTILFSKDGSVGIAYQLREDVNIITSSAIVHLISDLELQKCSKTRVLPEYLTLVLNSPIVQLQAERDVGGSILQHWRVSQIENTVIPIADLQFQYEIKELIEESFRLRKLSSKAIDSAENLIEFASETSENEALKTLNKLLNSF